MIQTIQPASDFLFCIPEEKETKTDSGFIISQGKELERKIAKVVNVGPKVSDFKSDDRIVYKEYAATDIKLDGADYILLKEEDVLGAIVEAGDV